MQASRQKMRFLYINGFLLESCHICMESLIICLHTNVNNSKFNKKNLKFDQHPPPLNSCDILAVQEHWLPDFNPRGVNSLDYCDRLSGRPHGGLCFVWRRSLDTFIEHIIYDDETRLLGLKITTSNATILLLNVYLPYQCDDNIDEYMATLGKTWAINTQHIYYWRL